MLKVIVKPESMVEAVVQPELGSEWTHDEGKLVYLKTYELKPASVAKAKKDGIKNPDGDKVLIVGTDKPDSNPKLMLLRNFLGYCKKHNVQATRKDGKDFILNDKLKATFKPNQLVLETL